MGPMGVPASRYNNGCGYRLGLWWVNIPMDQSPLADHTIDGDKEKVGSVPIVRLVKHLSLPRDLQLRQNKKPCFMICTI